MLPLLIAFVQVISVFLCDSEVSALPANSGDDKYTTRYDNIDVEAILKSKRLLKNYMECILERGPCTREGQELKIRLPDAMQTDCSKCSERQKQWAGKILAHLLQNEKGYWKQFLDKYDANGTFQKKFSYVPDGEEDNEDSDEEY